MPDNAPPPVEKSFVRFPLSVTLHICDDDDDDGKDDDDDDDDDDDKDDDDGDDNDNDYGDHDVLTLAHSPKSDPWP